MRLTVRTLQSPPSGSGVYPSEAAESPPSTLLGAPWVPEAQPAPGLPGFTPAPRCKLRRDPGTGR